MHLAYLTVGTTLARIVIYRTDPADPKEIFVSYANPAGGAWTRHEQFHAYAPDILVSPPILKQGFLLQTEGSSPGSCQGQFVDGRLVITQKQGFLRMLSIPTQLTERQTVAVEANRYSTELPPTDIIPISRVFDSYEPRKQYFVLLRPTKDRKGARVNGRSTECGGIVAPVRCALATIVSGKDMGWTGFAMWGGDGGIAIGGAEGVGEPWILLNDYERLPQKVRDEVLKAPEFIGNSVRRDTDSLASRC